MNPQQLMESIQETLRDLARLNNKLYQYGKERAYTEQRYRIELNKKLLELRLNKCPTSIINDVARGDKQISQLRLKRDLADNKFYVCKEAISTKKIEIESLRSLLTWQRVELSNT